MTFTITEARVTQLEEEVAQLKAILLKRTEEGWEESKEKNKIQREKDNLAEELTALRKEKNKIQRDKDNLAAELTALRKENEKLLMIREADIDTRKWAIYGLEVTDSAEFMQGFCKFACKKHPEIMNKCINEYIAKTEEFPVVQGKPIYKPRTGYWNNDMARHLVFKYVDRQGKLTDEKRDNMGIGLSADRTTFFITNRNNI